MAPTALAMLAHLAQATVFFAALPLSAPHAPQVTSLVLELAQLVEATARPALTLLLAQYVKADSHC